MIIKSGKREVAMSLNSTVLGVSPPAIFFSRMLKKQAVDSGQVDPG
jgi:hypothetical protein